MEDLPKITPQELALYRSCHFVHQVFRPRPALRSIEPVEDILEWVKSLPDGDEYIDPEKFEVVEGGWDHEHCDVCFACIEEGDPYWANERPGDVDLCEKCYLRVRHLIHAESS